MSHPLAPGASAGPEPRAYRQRLRQLLSDAWEGPQGRSEERVAVAEAIGRTTTAPLLARQAVPSFEQAAMDGFAVPAGVLASLGRGPVTVRVAGEVAAGDAPRDVRGGEVVQVMTGAPVGRGARAVVPVEHTSGFVADGGLVDLLRVVPDGANIRRRGEDLQDGALVLPAGTRLDPRKIAAVAAVGHSHVQVRSRLRVLVVATGSELVSPGSDLAPGQVVDCNGLLLAGLVESAGCGVIGPDRVPDDPAVLRALLTRRSRRADLVITAGGISSGTHEVVRDALGADLEHHRVRMRPGGPQGLGRFGDLPVIALPGNPVAAMVAFEVLVRPVLRELLGQPRRPPVPITQHLDVERHPTAWEYRLARTADDGSSALLRRGSASIAALAGADHLVVVPPAGLDRTTERWDIPR